MPIQPKPFRFVCTKCGYSKTVTPKSDALNPLDMNNTCPKCGEKMERQKLSSIMDVMKGLFRS